MTEKSVPEITMLSEDVWLVIAYGKNGNVVKQRALSDKGWDIYVGKDCEISQEVLSPTHIRFDIKHRSPK